MERVAACWHLFLYEIRGGDHPVRELGAVTTCVSSLRLPNKSPQSLAGQHSKQFSSHRVSFREYESFMLGCKQSCLPFDPKKVTTLIFQGCFSYKHPWRNIQSKRVVSTSFTRHAKSEKLMDNWFPTTAKIQIRLFNGSPYHRIKLVSPPGTVHLCQPHCLYSLLITWVAITLSSSNNVFLLASRSLLGWCLPEPPPLP